MKIARTLITHGPNDTVKNQQVKKLSPRAKFIDDIMFGPRDEARKRLARLAWDAMQLASTHDPDHAKELNHLANLIQAEVKLQDRRFTDVCARLSALEREASWNAKLASRRKS